MMTDLVYKMSSHINGLIYKMRQVLMRPEMKYYLSKIITNNKLAIKLIQRVPN